jgi:hypothetical protein
MKLSPVPSPRNTNFERLFMLRVPEGTDPKLALDAAMRAKDRKGARDEGEVDLGALRKALEHYLSQALPESHRQGALDTLAEHFEQREPQGKVYGTEDADDPDAVAESLWGKLPDHAADDREKMRSFMEGKGCSDEEIESVLEKMPRSAIEDRRRGARDRRRMAGDRALSAADSFEAFYGTSRIKGAL